jgi:hypothetical protein
MGGSNRATEIIVECSTISGENEFHKIYVNSDGYVETFDHDKASWGLDGATYEFLGGPKDVNPCLWWKQLNNDEKEHFYWREGELQIKTWHNTVFDVSSWFAKKVGVETDKSFSTIMKGFGILKEKDSFLYEKENFLDTINYIILIKMLKNEFNNTIYFSRLQEIMLSCSLREVADWTSHNVPYDSIVPLKSLGIPVDIASDICKEHFERWKVSSQPHSLGSPEYWVAAAKQEGIDIIRLADYMQRTRYNGLWYWRENVYKKVLEECKNKNLMFPNTWIVEAVASIPDREVLIRYTSNENFLDPNSRTPFRAIEKNSPLRSEKWTRGCAYTAGVERILDNLMSFGDPKTWEPGWEYPTLDEIKNDAYEKVDERVQL